MKSIMTATGWFVRRQRLAARRLADLTDDVLTEAGHHWLAVWREGEGHTLLVEPETTYYPTEG